MPDPSGPRTRMHAGDRRRAILNAALNAFSRKGFDGTTTKEIAAAAGVTEAIIFRHFPNKHQLYHAVLDMRTETPELELWLEGVRGYMERNDDEGLFRTLVASVFSSYREKVEFERVLLFAALEGHEFALAHHRDFSLAILAHLTEYLTRRQREGAFRDYCPGLIVAALAGAAEFYASRTQMFGFEVGDYSDDLVIETFTQIILNGIRSSPEGRTAKPSGSAERPCPANRKKVMKRK